MPQRPGHRIGFHVSIGGGLHRAVARARERNCTAFQLFCGNPRGWTLQERTEKEIERLRTDRAEADLHPLVVHACYLINPCAPDRSVFDAGTARLAAELDLSAALGADCYVLHPGSGKDRPADWRTKRASCGIGRALKRAGRAPTLLLEDTASLHGPGGSFATMAQLIDFIRRDVPSADLGIALDSCHAWAAGYDFRRPEEVARMVDEIAATVGIEALRLVHLNDARDSCGSHRDRHEHIGKGMIGRTGLRNLLAHPAIRHLPLILETPWESVSVDRRNLRAALALLHNPPTPG